MGERFTSPGAVAAGLAGAGYVADEAVAAVVFLADRLDKPVLVEGPAGTGKTQLAASVAQASGSRLLRLQCYEGLDEARALYEWNYRKQLLRIQVERDASWAEVAGDIFTEEFLLPRPLLAAISAADPVVLLVDEVDRLEVETEALLLEVLAEQQVSIPELGTIRATRLPLVFLTSNASRELSEALKRRCLFLHMDYPTPERERAIVAARVPDLAGHLADQVVAVVATLRQLELHKHPSISETVDWARALVALGAADVGAPEVAAGLPVLLKHHADVTRAAKELALGP